MAHIGCPACGRTIRSGETCSYCTGLAAPPTRVAGGWTRVVLLVVGAFVAGTILVAVFAPESAIDRRASAFSVCTQFVTEQLRAPATAQFPAVSAAVVNRMSGDEWEVRAHVDSQNGFGALLRSTFNCTVRFDGEDQWRLVDLKID